MAMRRFAGGTWVTSTPSMKIVPCGHLLQPGDHAQQRGLAAAGRPEQGAELALADGQVEILIAATAPKRLLRPRSSTWVISLPNQSA